MTEPSLEVILERINNLGTDVKLLRSEVKGLEYVRTDLYERDRDEIRRDLGSTRALAMWNLGILVTIVITAIVAIAVQLTRAT